MEQLRRLQALVMNTSNKPAQTGTCVLVRMSLECACVNFRLTLHVTCGLKPFSFMTCQPAVVIARLAIKKRANETAQEVHSGLLLPLITPIESSAGPEATRVPHF